MENNTNPIVTEDYRKRKRRCTQKKTEQGLLCTHGVSAMILITLAESSLQDKANNGRIAYGSFRLRREPRNVRTKSSREADI